MLMSWTLLTEINAARNFLTSIPESIVLLVKLIRLDFHQNKISSIPSSIMGCSSLAEFYMGTNLLSSLPAEIGALSRLGTLDLHSNQLKEYPVEACNLRLSVLDLSNNSLSGLPAEIGTMTSLRKLLLAGNPIRTLRSSLVSGPTPILLKYLRSRLSADEESGSGTKTMKDDQIARATRLSLSSKELNLSGLGLTTVPATVWETEDVVRVDLSKNSIEELPNELSTCSSLQALTLSGNKIREWPGAVLSTLRNLSCLKLDNNPLVQITRNGLESLTNIKILDLSGNKSSLPESFSFSSLPQLEELYLRRMQPVAPPVKDGNKNKKDQGKQDLKAPKHQPKKLSPLSSDEDDDDDGEDDEDVDDEVRLFDKLKQFNLLMQANNAAAGAKKNTNGNATGFMGGKKDGANPNQSHMKHPNGSAKKGVNVAAHQKTINTDPSKGEGRRVTDINGMTGLGLGGLGGNSNRGGFQGNVFHGYAGLPSHGGGQHQPPMMVNMQGYQAHPSPMMSNFRVHDNRYMQPQMMHLRSPQISPYTAYYNCHPSPYLQSNQSYNEYVTHLFSDDNTRGCVVM